MIIEELCIPMELYFHVYGNFINKKYLWLIIISNRSYNFLFLKGLLFYQKNYAL